MSEIIDIYKGRIIQKDTYFAFEIYNHVTNTWQEFVIRETMEQLKEIINTPTTDVDSGEIRVDESGRVITIIYPYYYEEVV